VTLKCFIKKNTAEYIPLLLLVWKKTSNISSIFSAAVLMKTCIALIASLSKNLLKMIMRLAKGVLPALIMQNI
tara:strand:- start:261 stop:479 length:219 start_codon:yes stop_codon:yes gene_type:complete